ncbi:MAG: penicillin-binding transpeptidase domain-containing protein [Clostridium sp.]|nr:penicillin-binding transpeptidase domain-containing protein [Clostridium sp.]MCM1547986.1 penicillin-binding transpeptidase domain-containing protein [Ruminococcus sp.]
MAMKDFFERLRTAFLAILVIVSVALGIIRLMTVQIVNGDAYLQKSEYTSVYTQDIKAVRGEIVDSEGNPIIGNKIGFSIIIDDTYFPSDNKEANEVLIQTVRILEEAGLKYNETIPITDTKPYEFKSGMDGDIEQLKSLIGVNVYATAENCIDKLIDDYEISANDYNEKDQRIIAGIRYEMKLRDFSLSNTFTLCEDVPIEIVTKLKELSIRLKGIDVSEDSVREIRVGDVIPHEIGTIGPIYAEEYEELKKKGYAMNDTVGKSGIEKALESELRGSDGTKTITLLNGEVTSAEVTEEPRGGHTVKLTVNSNFQRDLQTILSNFMAELRTQPAYSGVDCGSIVVLDVKSNAVLGMATAPTYDLKDYKSDYDKIAEAEDYPLINRATMGLYRPGSTFKTITATAGLNEGIISGGSTFRCQQKMEFYDIEVGCTGYHNDIAVAGALRVSCNIFFYELGRRLGIDAITKYASMYGYGQHTAIETGDAAGYIANPETFNELGIDWTVGHVLQASIGQSETNVTPLQMAGVASTIANRGVRYETHLVDSIYDYSMDNELKKNEPTIAQKIITSSDSVYDNVIDGMIQASTNNFPDKYSLSNLGFSVAIKTGTPQNWRNGDEIYDSCFIGFAPAYDPQIAFAGMIEEGEYSKYMIRSIIQAYYRNFSEDGSYPGDGINYLPTPAADTEKEKAENPTDTTEPVTEATEATDAAEPTEATE